jgi:hypothetical protein
MDGNDFWCRAFLATMGGHYTPTDHGKVVDHGPAASWCEKAADAALAVAQRREMVTGSAEPRRSPTAAFDALQRASLRWLAAAKANDEAEFEAAGEALLKAAEAIESDRAPAERPVPELERVEFVAWPAEGKQWTLRAPRIGALLVPSGRERFSVNGIAVLVKWGETCPTKPIEVWLERKGGA